MTATSATVTTPTNATAPVNTTCSRELFGGEQAVDSLASPFAPRALPASRRCAVQHNIECACFRSLVELGAAAIGEIEVVDDVRSVRRDACGVDADIGDRECRGELVEEAGPIMSSCSATRVPR